MENSQRYSKGIKNEISNEIKLENAKTEARLELNKETLDLFLKYHIVSYDSLKGLIDSGKLKITGVESILNQYEGSK